MSPAESTAKSMFKVLIPRVLPENEKIHFAFRILQPDLGDGPETIQVRYIRDDWRMSNGRTAVFTPGGNGFWDRIDCRAENGTLAFDLVLRGEHEHCVELVASDGEKRRAERYFFYTLAPDLFGFRPYKGVVHTHSTGSDGLYPPESVPAYMRRAGYDFTAVTDHKNFEPSLRAAASMRRFDSGLEVYSGEEVESRGALVGQGRNRSRRKPFRSRQRGNPRQTCLPHGTSAAGRKIAPLFPEAQPPRRKRQSPPGFPYGGERFSGRVDAPGHGRHDRDFYGEKVYAAVSARFIFRCRTGRRFRPACRARLLLR